MSETNESTQHAAFLSLEPGHTAKQGLLLNGQCSECGCPLQAPGSGGHSEFKSAGFARRILKRLAIYMVASVRDSDMNNHGILSKLMRTRHACGLVLRVWSRALHATVAGVLAQNPGNTRSEALTVTLNDLESLGARLSPLRPGCRIAPRDWLH